MHVFYCNNIYEHPQTGGEIFYAEILNLLRNHKDVDLIFPNEIDLHFFKRARNCLRINLHFFNKFRRLPQKTIIIESEFYFYNFFLCNWLIKLWRRDLRVAAQICQVPDILLSESKIRWIHRIMMFLFLRAADVVTVLSQSQKGWMIRLGAFKEKIHVVYIAAQRLKDFESRLRKKRDNKPLRIVCVAHIRPRKGQKILIKALHRLRDIPFEALLVGGIKDEIYGFEVRRDIEKYGLLGKVKLTGLLEGESLSRAYAESDIFVLPSFHEPYGIVVQEAMSFDLPVIASGIDGITEQVTDGIEGILVPPGDAVALAGALKKLISDVKLRSLMGNNARKRSEKLYTWEQVYGRFYYALRKVSLET